MITINADSVLKLYVCFSGIVISSTALFQPESTLAQMLRASGNSVPYVMTALLCVAILGLVDVFINDCMSKEYRFAAAARHRTWTLAAIGGIHMLVLFIIVAHGQMNWSGGRLIIDGTAAAVAMLMDVQARYVGPRRGRRAVDHAVSIDRT